MLLQNRKTEAAFLCLSLINTEGKLLVYCGDVGVMSNICFNGINKNNGLIKLKPSVMHMESSLSEHHNELSIKHITLGIYQLGCHLGNKRFLRMPTQKMNVNLGDYNDTKKS